MVAARRRSASSGPLRGLERHVRRRARSCVQSNLPAMPTIGEGSLIPPISGQSLVLAQHTGGSNLHLVLRSLVDSGGSTETVGDLENGKGGGMTIMRFGAAMQAAR